MSQATQGILILSALMAVELFGVVVAFPEWKRRHEQWKQQRQKQQNPPKE